MALSSRLAKNGTPATSLEVRADVTFDQGESGWKIASSALKVSGNVPGIDAETFTRPGRRRQGQLPDLAVALKGNVDLSVEATLAGAPAPELAGA